MSAVTTLFADAVGALVPALAGGTARAVLLVAVLALFAGINVAGVRQGNAVNALATVAKLLPLLLLVAFGVMAIRAENLAWTATPAAGDVARDICRAHLCLCGS